jgi:hypothetical protein
MSTRKSAKSAHAVARSRSLHDRLRQARNIIRRTGQFGVLVFLILALGACGAGIVPTNDPAQPDSQPGGWYKVIDVNVHGKMVPCVTWKQANAGGISCDFAGSK